MEEKNKISVSIIDLDKGLTMYEDVECIRVHSKEYKLMIMTDHAPVLGEVDGDIIILTSKKEHKKMGVKGYFIHTHNHFKFIEEYKK